MNPELEKIIQKYRSSVELSPTPGNDPKPNQRLFDSGIFYTVADIASLVGLSTRTVERCIQRGELKATRIGRKKLIRKEWVESWLQP